MKIEDVKGTGNVGADIARHYYARVLIGKVIIVAENPEVLLKVLQRQWSRLTRKLQIQRTQMPSNRVVTVMDLTFAITKMQCQRFTASLPSDDPRAHIFILRPTDMNDVLPEFATLYITHPIDPATLKATLAAMPANSSVIRYS